MRMAMAFHWFSITADPGEYPRRSTTLIGPLTQCVMDSVGNRNGLSESRRDGTDNCVACNGRYAPAGNTCNTRYLSKGIRSSYVIYEKSTGWKIPTCSLEFASVGMQSSEKINW